MDAKVKPADALRCYRDNAEITLKDLSEKTGIAIPHLSAMENGKRNIGKISAQKLGGIDDFYLHSQELILMWLQDDCSWSGSPENAKLIIPAPVGEDWTWNDICRDMNIPDFKTLVRKKAIAEREKVRFKSIIDTKTYFEALGNGISLYAINGQIRKGNTITRRREVLPGVFFLPTGN